MEGDLGPICCTVATIGHPTALSKWWASVGGPKGGVLGVLTKTHWGMCSFEKIMNLKGDKSTIQPLSVRYTNSPQMGVYGGFPFLQAHVALI